MSHMLKIMRSILIQNIPRWLKQPNVWRFVCSASSVIGLLCYALSPSFNHLFGKWTLLKVFLYSVFSLIIWVTILFAKVWQHSSNLQLKAHLAYLVLMTTSVYSFFFDKVLNGKPDSYSLISSAAFAIMSLGLSRQTQYGFEIDLLYFFSGFLTIQLMRINLFLIIVGACFSYFLIILRSSLDTSSENLHLGLQNHVIIQLDSGSQETNTGTGNTDSASIMTFDASPENWDLDFQNHVVTQVDSHSSQGNSDTSHIMPQLMASINALKNKNRKLIHMISKHVEKYLEAVVDSKKLNQSQLLTDVNLVMDVLPSRTISDLREAVKLMVAAGLEKECCQVYSNCRREFLEECLLMFRLQELDKENIDHMEKIESWTKAFNVVVKILFPNERTLCDHVFHGFSSAADISFIGVCRDLTIHLLSFANAFTIGSHSLNLLCRIIPEVWETLHYLVHEFESLFSDQSNLSLRYELRAVRKKLIEATECHYIELNNLICRDLAQVVVPYGRLHPVTCEVMNCIGEVCKDMEIMPKHVFKKYLMGLDEESYLLSNQIAWIIEQLEGNLEANSKNYMDPALGYVFMMNNQTYIVEVMEKFCPLSPFLRRDLTQKYTAKVRQNFEDYQRSSWNKVLDFLKLENDELVAPDIVEKSMKEKLNLFNRHFEEICSIQSKWFVYDERQRDQIRIFLEIVLLPMYGNFIRRFQNVLGGKHADKDIKYGMFQIVDKLNNLFLGSKGMKQQLEEK